MAEHADNLRNRVFCSSCGASEMRRGGLVQIGWEEMADAADRRIALCPRCVRNNLWFIEARLEFDPGSGF